MNVALITTCTNRKRKPVPFLLQASSLPYDSQDAVLSEWLTRISMVILRHKASTIYCGRSFTEACKAKNTVSGELWIISAGLGLVYENEEIPSYSLTLSKSVKDSVLEKINGPVFFPTKWWKDLNSSKGTPNPLHQLVSNKPEHLFVIALSRAYASMVQHDLLSLSDKELLRIRLIGLAINDFIEPRLQDLVMPYDERFDGPGSLNPGTRVDFAQRAMGHFVGRILKDLPDGDPFAHAYAVSQILSHNVAREIPRRMRLSDIGVMDIIKNHWSDSAGSSSRMLRILRDHENIACEQRRFQQLFRMVKEEVAS